MTDIPHARRSPMEHERDEPQRQNSKCLEQKMQIEIATITPDQAKAMLARNHKNRPLNPHHVTRMSIDMQKGNWIVNGDAIRLSDVGDLMDGQHRLNACVSSGVPFQTVLVRGLDGDAARTIDGGRKRTVADKFNMDGVKNAKAMATALRLLGKVAAQSKSYQPSDQEFYELLDIHPGLADSVSRYKNVPFRLSSIISALHYIAATTTDQDVADAFAETVRSGIPTRENDPAHTFREWVIRNATGQSLLSFESILVAACRAWSCYRDDKGLSRIVAGGKLEIAGWDRKRLFSRSQVPSHD